MSVKFKVRFTKDMIENRAPKNSKKGGFEKLKIAEGSERIVNAASLNYWMSRGAVEIVERVSADPFGLLDPSAGAPAPAAPADQLLSKKAVRAALDDVLKGIEADEDQVILDALNAAQIERLPEVLNGIQADDLQLIIGFRDDLAQHGSIGGNTTEIAEALVAVRELTLPPSQRKR